MGGMKDRYGQIAFFVYMGKHQLLTSSLFVQLIAYFIVKYRLFICKIVWMYMT